MNKIFLKVLAMVSAFSMIFAFAACSKEDDSEKTSSTEPQSVTIESGADTTTVAPESTQAQSEQASAEQSSAIVTEAQSVNAEDSTKPGESTSANPESKTTVKDTTAKAESKAPKTKAEVIKYCNTALNAVKSKKAGYDKHHVMKVVGEVEGLPEWVLAPVKKDKTTTTKKGEDSTENFPASGFSWSSKLTENDVKSYEFKESGKYYIIKLKLGSEVNPAVGNSSYGRCMSVIDAEGAKEMLSVIKTIKMTYHDGYIYAKIDSTTGKVVECEMSANADVEADISLLGEKSVKDIVSTETYTNFVW